jgi:hypothetical protein
MGPFGSPNYAVLACYVAWGEAPTGRLFFLRSADWSGTLASVKLEVDELISPLHLYRHVEVLLVTTDPVSLFVEV